MLRPCLDVPRWVDAVADGRPYGTLEAVLDAAAHAAKERPRWRELVRLTGARIE